MLFTSITKLIKISLLATIFFALTGLQTYSQATEYCQISQIVNVKSWDVLNIRKHPNPRSRKMGRIPSGQACIETTCETAYDKGSAWVKVNYDGVIGWVNYRYLREMSSHDSGNCW